MEEELVPFLERDGLGRGFVGDFRGFGGGRGGLEVDVEEFLDFGDLGRQVPQSSDPAIVELIAPCVPSVDLVERVCELV